MRILAFESGCFVAIHHVVVHACDLLVVMVDNLVDDLLPRGGREVQRIRKVELHSDRLASFIGKLTYHPLQLCSRILGCLFAHGIGTRTSITFVILGDVDVGLALAA